MDINQMHAPFSSPMFTNSHTFVLFISPTTNERTNVRTQNYSNEVWKEAFANKYKFWEDLN
jgi:hypothetical protein